MKKIIFFLFCFLAALGAGFIALKSIPMPVWVTTPWQLTFQCAVTGGTGGCLYCLRAVYLNACVRKNWDQAWEVWYYLRPFISVLCGGVSCLFLKAGLLLLDASRPSNSSNLGFYAFAFIAGLNVDKFIAKVEDIAQATWGIEKSRSTSGSKDSDPAPKV